ncbi:MAG: YdiU family protein [Lysobacterales bacterium]
MFPAIENTYSQLPEIFFAHCQAQNPSDPALLMFNEPLAGQLGFSRQDLSDETLAHTLSGKAPLPGSKPLAMAYAGHQFGHFVPQLGDGRALLLGEVVVDGLGRQDIQLKGSGRTPFSRGGDGLAALGPVLREYLVSEAMAKLGVPTTRALAAVATGDPVLRETGRERGAVLTRVASSHIRVGTFQFFAARGDEDALRALTDHAVTRHVDTDRHSDNVALTLIAHVTNVQAELVAHWMRLGFVHGVMNTDNCAVSGETIDYGPCAFMDTYNPATVFSSIDQQGRYAYANQPGIAQWNIARLAETLLPLIDNDQDKAIALATAEVEKYPDIFQRHWRRLMGTKLGLSSVVEDDDGLIQDLLALMQSSQRDFTDTFRQLAGGIEPGADGAFMATVTPADAAPWQGWLSRWRARLATQNSDTPVDVKARMDAVNPAVIPRNHEVEKALNAARNDNNLEPLLALHAALGNPFESTADNAWLRKLPDPGLPHYRTFCGT